MEEGDGERSEALKSALLLLPEYKKYDYLVNNWLNHKHDQCYALDPTEFRTQYERWWATPCDKFIVEGGVTELDGMDVRELADRAHTAAKKLSESIPPGEGGLAQVQQLFLTAIWLESSEKRTEAWHVLGVAIMAAYELGLHRTSLLKDMLESERERGRRTWVILCLWDCSELSPELSLSCIINLADCIIEAPRLSLESDPRRLDRPFLHLELHYQLCVDIAEMAAQLDSLRSTRAEAANQMRIVITNWTSKLSEEYAQADPNTDWVVHQREYLHLIEAAARVNHTLQRDNQKMISVFDLLKDSLSMLGQACSDANKTAAQHQSLEGFLAPPPLPPTLPQVRLSEVPQNIIDKFGRFIDSFISKNADGEGYRPINHLLGDFEVERWRVAVAHTILDADPVDGMAAMARFL
ncbi:hypothetical protein B0H63DRAFT_450015 [Podospora didyma]|uniref:Xylanolytic transcriptional activator regulatory domain-containing protein n=1 Tax=Podospora didyma TaxID=330526 RepID=A0AAE0U027_9PEZI|nr:hypothetical protein B0H63DRAFT_450015 [Podospora didyma]